MSIITPFPDSERRTGFDAAAAVSRYNAASLSAMPTMSVRLLTLLFRLTALLPLPLLHGLAVPLARLLYHAAPQMRRRIADNLHTARLPASPKDIRAVLRETVKGSLELAPAFCRPPAHTAALFVEICGREYLDTACREGRGILLLTPHLGSYDLAGRCLSEILPFPLTAMYKPPKIAALDTVMQQGRQRGKGRTAPTNRQGVKQLIQALRQSEAVVLLPDHVPVPAEGGEGVWADFFGRPAYTMTLAAKLAGMKNVCPLLFVGERLPWGRGFRLHIEPLSGSLNGDKTHDAELINRQIETWIRRLPAQYLFAYNRYKAPAGAPPPPERRPR